MPKVSRCGQVVDEEALTFLQQKGVIDLAFATRYAALAGQNQEKTFACPAAGCGRTLIAVIRTIVAGIWVAFFQEYGINDRAHRLPRATRSIRRRAPSRSSSGSARAWPKSA